MKLFNIILGCTLVFFIVIFLRCEKVTEISELIKNTDKIQLIYYNDSLPNTVIEITDKKEIKKFSDYISNTDTPIYKCKYDGQIIFILNQDIAVGKNNTVSMEFNLQSDCVHVAYMYSESLHTKELSEEGLKFLRENKK